MGHFHQLLSSHEITPLFKKGDPLLSKNYRPIANLPTISKVFEKVIFNQLIAHFEGNKLLNDSQHGFRSSRSTITALINIYENLISAAEKQHFCGLLMIDFSAAFDLINPGILLDKMRLYNFDESRLYGILFIV